MRFSKIVPFCIFTALLLFGNTVLAEEAKNIQDNSFLIEEAYNQEPGVVQHIQMFQYYQKSYDWFYTFTQEWPVPNQTNQFSYVIPVTRLYQDDATGLGDVMLNYRYQAVLNDTLALAPRLTLILPTGDYKKGLGTGTVGYQMNIPLSIQLSDKFVSHWNFGMTYTPHAKDTTGEKSNLLGYNYGGSIIYLATENFNLMLEAAGTSTETHPDIGLSSTSSTFFINPGIRFAINFRSGLQIVPGLSMPIGIGPSGGEYGALVYLSFEHPLF
jgi:hypothetical protein